MSPQNVIGDGESVAFTILQDPGQLRVNLRYRNSHTLPPVVLSAIKNVVTASQEACSQTDWTPGDAYVGVAFDFFVDSRKEDVDGPIKRVLDAVAEGCKFNDGRVKRVLIERTIVPDGAEHMAVNLYRVQPDPGETLPARWKGNDPQFVWQDDGGANNG